MKNFVFIILLSTLVLSCSNNDESNNVVFESTGKITGFDRGACACCGGWFIEIDGYQSFFRFNELPQDSNIDLFNSTFPILVNLNWSEFNPSCGIIVVDDIALRQ